MNKFLLFLITTIHIILVISLKAQVEPTLVRFDNPEFIPVNSAFDVSLVIKFDKFPKENVTFAFKKNKGIKVQGAYLNLNENPKKLFVKVRKQIVKLVIPFKNLSNIKNTPIQIILKCRGKGERRIEGDLFTSQYTLAKFNEENKEEKIVRFYTPQVIAGKSLVIKNSTNFRLNIIKDSDWENLFFEYWIKSITKLNNFFNVINENADDTLLSLSENNLGFLTIPLNENETIREDVFLGNKNWNYLAIRFSKKFDQIVAEVFVNSKLVYSTLLSSLIDFNNLKFSFHNKSKKNFEIDRLKIWNFKDNIDLALKNKNFLTFEADSSENLLELNFDKKSELKQVEANENFHLSYNNIKYKKSNAPIFSKAPKLTVTIGSSYNSLIWYVQEYSFAKEFILEKSANGEEFKEVYKVDADDDPLKIYTYIDEVVNSDEVSYYRIRQINKDNSEVISPEVKIGNKEITEFKVRQNYPNPFNPLTNIYVDVMTTTEIKVNVYDLVGNKVEQLYDGILPQGLHTFPFDGSNLPSGIYFFEVASPHAQVVKKMILAK